MKVCILAFDGLDYNYVLKFKCKSLMQREYGVVDIDSMSLTPTIWASFLTGKPPRIHGAIRKSNDKPLYSIISPLRKISIPLIIKSSGMYLLRRLTHTSMMDIRIKFGKTIFDYAKNPIALWVPSYNPCPKWWSLKFSYMLEKALEDPQYELSYLCMVYKHFKDHVTTFLRFFKDGKWDLFMAWFGIADRVGHVFGGRIGVMMRAYHLLSKFVRKVHRLLRERTVLLIVSDHGIKPYGKYGVHAPYAYYSLNINLGITKPKITDFHNIIKVILET